MLFVRLFRYSTSTSKICHKISPMKTHILVVFEFLLTLKVFLYPNIEDMSFFIRIVLFFHLLIVSLGTAFPCLRNPILDNFLKHKQHAYALKKPKPEIFQAYSLSLHFFHAHNFQKIYLTRPAMQIQMLCKNVLDITCSTDSFKYLFWKISNTSGDSERSAFKQG